ncbi:flagellar biosynthetic protein FliO [Lysobacter sp. FW306-1B-D06B]|uniref:flagellar biosynthetic protein FliO n=1 Tax=unclassified Lysobacter TaxID=2635362 RepID=UPI001C23E004|nr:flagellar biosynthetic protein FliO [Lysobacter sp. MMG2]
MAFVGTRANGAQAVPPHPLQAGGAKAGGAANAQHTATVAHPAKPQAFAKPADGPGIGGAVFALILVVSLILGLGWLARRMPGVGRASNTNALRVVGSLALGPRDRVVVVEVGNTQLLLGVGQNGMTTLHTLAEPLPLAQPSQGNAVSPFAQLLAQHFGKKP